MAIKGGQETITLDGLTYTLDDRDRVAAQIVQESENVLSANSTIQYTNPVLQTDAAETLTVAANAGRTTIIPNVSADRIYTLPQVAEGLHIHLVGFGALAADGHDVSIITDTANTEFYHGAVVHHDSNQTGQTSAVVWGNGSSNDTIKLDTPEAFDIHFLGKSSTVWYVWGWSAGVTPITISDA